MIKATLALRRMVSQEAGFPIFIPIIKHFQDNKMGIYLSALMQAEASMEYNEETKGFFPFPRAAMEEATGLSADIQAVLNNKLVSDGIIEQRMMGHKGFKVYRLNWDKIADIFEQHKDCFTFSSLRNKEEVK